MKRSGFQRVLDAIKRSILVRRGFDPSLHYTRTPGRRTVYRCSPAGTPGIDQDAHEVINAIGLRGELPRLTSKPAIVVFGGSTSEEIMLEYARSWPGTVQCRLRQSYPDAWVGNAGKSGATAPQVLRQIQVIAPRLKPLDFIVSMSGLNDMLFDFRMHHPKHLSPAWNDEQAFMHHPTKGSAGASLAPAISELKVSDFGLVMERYRARYGRVRDEDFIRVCPDKAAPLAAYRATVGAIADAAETVGARMVFVTQPYLWRDGMSPEAKALLYAGGENGVDQWELDDRNPWYHHSVMRELLEAYNQVTRDVAHERRALLIDLEQLLPPSPAYFFDDFHFSAAGACAAGDIIASSILSAIAKT